MSAIASMTLAGFQHSDGVTALNKVLMKEANVTGGIRLRDSIQPDFTLASRLTFTVKGPTATSKMIREKTTLTIPYKDPVTGLLAGVITRNIEDIVPSGAPLNVRKDAAQVFSSLATNAVVKDMIINLDFAS